METTSGKSIITVRNVLRIIAPLCFIIGFCPTFMVSCSGKEFGVNVMTAVQGVTLYGDRVVEPNPIMILCLLIPAVIFVVLFVKTIKEMTSAAVIASCGTLDLLLWIIFRLAVQSEAEKNLCNFKSTPWFVINIISLGVIILFSCLVLLKKLQMDSDLIAIVSGVEMHEKLHLMPSEKNNTANGLNNFSVDSTSDADIVTIGFCPKCGSAIEYDCIFCTSCGAPVPQSMIDEAESAKKEAEERARAAEIAANRAAEEKARQEEEARKAAEERAKQEEAARKAAEERARQEEAARREAAEKARQEAIARREAEERARAEEQAKLEGEAGKLPEDSNVINVFPIHNDTTQNVNNGEASQLYCPRCGTMVAPTSKFCGECGGNLEQLRAEEAARLADETRTTIEEVNLQNRLDPGVTNSEEERPIFCEYCGAKLLPDSLFCGECGTKVE